MRIMGATIGPDRLNLRHIRAFCTVAQCGSISAAAGDVHLSQPAITQAIAKLERSLDTTLFARSAMGMAATEAGSLLLARAGRALDLLKAGAQLCRGRSETSAADASPDFDRRVTSTQLRALLAVSECGNFTLAARAIGVSQPSLHRLARDLERLSGVRLFAATTRGAELSPSALVLERHARLAFAELTQGFEELNALRGIDSARIMIGTLPLARSSILPGTINALARLRPEVQVGVVDGPYDDLLHGLRHGRLDLIIGALRLPVPIDDVVQETLFHDRLAVVARNGHPLVGKPALSVGDLAGYPWVIPRRGPPTREHFDALFQGAGLDTPKGLVEASSLVLIRGLLLGSDRLTLVSAHQIQHEERTGMLRRLPLDLAHTSRPIGTTVRRNWHPTATQRLFLALLREVSQGTVQPGRGYSKTG
jgi:LysR family transcriptional regulator, regulator for genes of the gallate degradation pathway